MEELVNGLYKWETKPIYRTCRASMVDVSIIVSKMNKQFKYLLGQRLFDSILKMCEVVYKALQETDYNIKSKLVKDIKMRTSDVLLILRVCNDVNQVNRHEYETLVDKLMNINNQTDKWNVYINKIIGENNEKSES